MNKGPVGHGSGGPEQPSKKKKSSQIDRFFPPCAKHKEFFPSPTAGLPASFPCTVGELPQLDHRRFANWGYGRIHGSPEEDRFCGHKKISIAPFLLSGNAGQLRQLGVNDDHQREWSSRQRASLCVTGTSAVQNPARPRSWVGVGGGGVCLRTPRKNSTKPIKTDSGAHLGPPGNRSARVQRASRFRGACRTKSNFWLGFFPGSQKSWVFF